MRSGHNLSDLILLLVQLELDEEFRKHDVDSVQGDVGLTELMLRVLTVPDVTDCPLVLCDSTQCIIDKCYNGSWTHVLLRFDA